jgi:hypothetical protein
LRAVATGRVFTIQNDPAFHFRASADPERETLIFMLPNEFDVGCLAIRDLEQCPADPNIFMALADCGRANVYQYRSEKVELLKAVTSSDWKGVALEGAEDTVLFEIGDWKKAPRCLAVAPGGTWEFSWSAHSIGQS